MARRECLSVFWSDNGKKLLLFVHSWNQQQVSSGLAQKGIRWRFNPPADPHHVGSWERTVGSFKRIFSATIGSRRLTDEILSTTFCFVEQSLHARPMSSVSSDPNDLTALTPNQFFLGLPGTSPALVSVSDH